MQVLFNKKKPIFTSEMGKNEKVACSDGEIKKELFL
jgi:hypothetical protein